LKKQKPTFAIDLGFEKTKADLRNRGEEELWVYKVPIEESKLKSKKEKIEKKNSYTLQDIPKRFRGVFIKLIGKRKTYTPENVKRVVEFLRERAKENGASIDKNCQSQFFYNWERDWDNAQRFDSNVTEKVVVQRLSSQVQDMIEGSEALLKFWSMLLSSSGQHFGNDVIGFTLLSPIKEKTWLINEVQTDCVNSYHRVRRLDKDTKKKSKITWEVVKDILDAQGKSKWKEVIEENHELKHLIMEANSPENMIEALPVDIEPMDWIKSEIKRWDSPRSDGNTNPVSEYFSELFPKLAEEIAQECENNTEDTEERVSA
jgi:hypothetical protein